MFHFGEIATTNGRHQTAPRVGAAPRREVGLGDLDVVGGVVGEALAVLVVPHGGLEVLVAQVGLDLLRLGAALDGQGAAGVPEHVGSDAAVDAIIMMDGDGRIAFWNPAAARMLDAEASQQL